MWASGSLIDRTLLGWKTLGGTPDEGFPLPFWTVRSFKKITRFQAHILDKKVGEGSIAPVCFPAILLGGVLFISRGR